MKNPQDRLLVFFRCYADDDVRCLKSFYCLLWGEVSSVSGGWLETKPSRDGCRIGRSSGCSSITRLCDLIVLVVEIQYERNRKRKANWDKQKACDNQDENSIELFLKKKKMVEHNSIKSPFKFLLNRIGHLECIVALSLFERLLNLSLIAKTKKFLLWTMLFSLSGTNQLIYKQLF